MSNYEITGPESILGITEVKAAWDMTDVLLTDIESELVALDGNLLVETSDENGLKRREEILGIKYQDDETLSDRKYRVMLRWYDNGRYTEESLRRLLDNLVGTNKYILTIDLDAQSVDVKLSLKTKHMRKITTEMLESTIPMNMTLTVDLLYNSWKSLSGKTWAELETGTWKHWKEDSLDEEVTE